jgi:hypothetical protein
VTNASYTSIKQAAAKSLRACDGNKDEQRTSLFNAKPIVECKPFAPFINVWWSFVIKLHFVEFGSAHDSLRLKLKSILKYAFLDIFKLINTPKTLP